MWWKDCVSYQTSSHVDQSKERCRNQRTCIGGLLRLVPLSFLRSRLDTGFAQPDLEWVAVVPAVIVRSWGLRAAARAETDGEGTAAVATGRSLPLRFRLGMRFGLCPWRGGGGLLLLLPSDPGGVGGLRCCFGRRRPEPGDPVFEGRRRRLLLVLRVLRSRRDGALFGYAPVPLLGLAAAPVPLRPLHPLVAPPLLLPEDVGRVLVRVSEARRVGPLLDRYHRRHVRLLPMLGQPLPGAGR